MQKHHATGLGGLGIGSVGGLVGALYMINSSLTQIATTCSQLLGAIPTP